MAGALRASQYSVDCFLCCFVILKNFLKVMKFSKRKVQTKSKSTLAQGNSRMEIYDAIEELQLLCTKRSRT